MDHTAQPVPTAFYPPTRAFSFSSAPPTHAMPVAQPTAMNVIATAAAAASSPPRASVRFPAFPHDVFFYSVATDKLETVVAIESKSSKDQWECRVDDEALKKCGPENVEIPRSVVATLLSETLDKMKKQQEEDKKPTPNATDGHSAELHPDVNGSDLQLVLSLNFGAGWCPTYRLVLTAKEVKAEDRLRAQIADLQEEMAQMHALMKKMECQLAQQAATCQSARHRY